MKYMYICAQDQVKNFVRYVIDKFNNVFVVVSRLTPENVMHLKSLDCLFNNMFSLTKKSITVS